MKAWTTAAISGRCAYDGTRWKAGDRIFVLQGATWRKYYCAACAKTRHGAGEDTGELLDLTDRPKYPEKLLEFTGATRLLFNQDEGEQTFQEDRAR